jgi:glutamyl-tRNA synthetase
MKVDETKFNDFVQLKALEVAIANSGQANPKAILGRCFKDFPEIKADIPKYSQIIAKITATINTLTQDEQKAKVLELNPEFSEKKEKKVIPKSDGLPTLENTENGVVVRIEPAPSGHLHLGHLFSIVANFETKKKFGGKFVVRIADTNPDNIALENYQKVIEDIKWICGETKDNKEIDEIVYQSDRVQLYHKYLRNLVEIDKAYICECQGETFKNFTDSSEQCPHAKIEHKKQLVMFDKFMTGGYEVGEAVVRYRADISHKNPAMRSFGLARLNKTEHARVGHAHTVWPTMHLTVAIDDSLMGMTHVIRGKDHEVNMDRQKLIQHDLGLKSPEYFHTGRMKFTDLELSKTKLSEKIETGEFENWADPRVPSLLSHKIRGYKPEAFRKFILQLGISKRDSKITKDEYYKGLDFFNKQIIEVESNRYFSIINPVEVEIENITEIDFDEFTIQKHPENPGKGFRHIQTINKYLIENQDFQKLEVGTKMRLMHFANFEILSKDEGNKTVKLKYLSQDYNKDLGIKANIHFVSANGSETENVTIIDSENNKIEAVSEKIEKYQIGDSIQYERYGFLRLDRIDEDKNKVFYFTHK